MFIPVNGGQGISRPFVVGLILLLVFLGMQSDLVPSRPESTIEEAAAPAKDVTKERIILELSKSNEKLEKELHQLQQHLLLVKHAAHQHGVEHGSKLGSMLYDNDVALPAESNPTDVRSASRQDAAASGAADQLSDAHAQGLDMENVSDTGSRHEMPHRTHHHVQQNAASP